MGDGLLDGLTSEQVHMVRHLVELLRRANESLARVAVVAPVEPAGHPSSLLSVTEAANMLGISRASLYPLLGQGDLESVAIGRRRLIPLSAIEKYVRSLSGRA